MDIVTVSRSLLFAPSGGAPSAAVSLDVDMEAQTQDQWCWAAVSVAVARHYQGDSTWTQCGLATAELGLGGCCTSAGPCNKPWYLDRALTRVGHLDGIAGPLAFADVVDELDDRQPLGVRIRWRGGGGHFVLVDGYDAETGTVQVKDPWGDETVTLSHAQLRDRYSGAGTWTHSYRTRS